MPQVTFFSDFFEDETTAENFDKFVSFSPVKCTYPRIEKKMCFSDYITKTCLYNVDTLKSKLYIVNFEFAVYRGNFFFSR